MATGCSNGEPSELKMTFAWVLGRSFYFFAGGKLMHIYLHIDVAMCLFAIVEILKVTLMIIEKCKKH